jgi:heptosyltransferase-2
MHSILIVRFSSLGDIILAEPVVRALRRRFPDAGLSFLTKARYLPLLQMLDGISGTYGIAEDGRFADLVAQLRRDKVDLIIDLHRNLRSSRLKSKLKVRSLGARKEWWRRFASVRLKKLALRPSHAVERYLVALKPLAVKLRREAPRLSLPEQYSAWWQEERQARGIAAGYSVFAVGAAHATKMAPQTLWREIADKLGERGWAAPLIVGAPTEREKLSSFSQVLGLNDNRVITEADLCRAAALIAGARFLISNDSGLAHLGAGLRVPTLALFGPTHPVLGFEPLGETASYYTVNEYCSPCSLHGRRRCFREQRYCFTRMSAAAICDKIGRLIGA